MRLYQVLLEGKESDSIGYFLTLEIAATSKVRAKKLALAKAAENGLEITGVEEIEFKEYLDVVIPESVLKIYGKSYYSINE